MPVFRASSFFVFFQILLWGVPGTVCEMVLTAKMAVANRIVLALRLRSHTRVLHMLQAAAR
jgi:hypothetical protein